SARAACVVETAQCNASSAAEERGCWMSVTYSRLSSSDRPTGSSTAPPPGGGIPPRGGYRPRWRTCATDQATSKVRRGDQLLERSSRDGSPEDALHLSRSPRRWLPLP